MIDESDLKSLNVGQSQNKKSCMRRVTAHYAVIAVRHAGKLEVSSEPILFICT